MKEKQLEPTTFGLASDEASTFKSMSFSKMLLKATGLSLIFVVILLLLTAVGVSIFAYSKFNEFLTVSNLTFNDVKSMVQGGISETPPTTDGRTTILVLGTDTVSNKEAPPLTDTMLLMSIDYETAQIELLSLPRDLWSESYKTKINALYYYGQEKYPDNPERFPTEVVSDMTGIPINYTVVFSLDSIAEIVHILGGIDVDVPTSFIDTEFPREDVDVSTTTDPDLLYETVEFQAGTEHMSEERVKKYIRSRHSHGDTGTDLDRAARQQLVITSLIKTITSKEVLTNPTTMAKLYNWYDHRLSPFIPVTDAISIAYALYPQRSQLALNSNALSIKTETDEGVIEHLPIHLTNNQWTYSIVDGDSFRNSVKEILY